MIKEASKLTDERLAMVVCAVGSRRWLALAARYRKYNISRLINPISLRSFINVDLSNYTALHDDYGDVG